MRKKVLLSAVSLLFAAAVSMPVAAQNIIPQPENISLLKGQFKLNKGTKIVTNLTGSDFKVLNQYTSEVLKHPLAYAKNPSQQGVFRLICKGTAKQAAQAMDSVRLQGYELEVTPKGITIQALTPTGLFYGLQRSPARKGWSDSLCKGEGRPSFRLSWFDDRLLSPLLDKGLLEETD